MKLTRPFTPEEAHEHFRLRAKSVGWTLTELCRRARVHRTTVSFWKEGAWPTLATLSRLEKALEPVEKALADYESTLAQKKGD